jgi:pseudouridine synthase
MPRSDGGLEILTSDGELAARLQRAVRHLPMEFSVRVRGALTPVQIEGVLKGRLEGGEQLSISECEPGGGEGANRWCQVTGVGINGRDLRMLLEQQGATVSRVLRVELGGLKLERTLARGQARQLTPAEIGALLGRA